MFLHRKYLVFIFFCLFFSIFLNAQENSTHIAETTKSNFWKKVRFGGGIGLSFGNNYTNLAISPSGIYQFNNQFAGGVGLNANYASRKYYFDATVIGASLIGLFNPIKELQVSAELEQNNVSLNDKIVRESINYWYPALYLGAGYAIGNFGAIGMRYDVLYNRKSVYGSAFSPFVRVFF